MRLSNETRAAWFADVREWTDISTLTEAVEDAAATVREVQEMSHDPYVMVRALSGLLATWDNLREFLEAFAEQYGAALNDAPRVYDSAVATDDSAVAAAFTKILSSTSQPQFLTAEKARDFYDATAALYRATVERFDPNNPIDSLSGVIRAVGGTTTSGRLPRRDAEGGAS